MPLLNYKIFLAESMAVSQKDMPAPKEKSSRFKCCYMPVITALRKPEAGGSQVGAQVEQSSNLGKPCLVFKKGGEQRAGDIAPYKELSLGSINP